MELWQLHVGLRHVTGECCESYVTPVQTLHLWHVIRTLQVARITYQEALSVFLFYPEVQLGLQPPQCEL